MGFTKTKTTIQVLSKLTRMIPPYKTVRTTKDNGTNHPTRDMEEVIKCGLMEVSTMVTGKMIKLMDVEG